MPQSLPRDGKFVADLDGEGDGEGDGEQDTQANTEMAITEVPVVPVMYRWISTSKGREAADDRGSLEKTMTLSFSVPISVMGVAIATSPEHADKAQARTAPVKIDGPSLCDVAGCTALRKYRLVEDWTRGACGMQHLKLLEIT